ncbi:MAG: minor capsid protein [Methanobrevibacter woesei]|nr:minor capsid protein [Methanobrevibacter woesei]
MIERLKTVKVKDYLKTIIKDCDKWYVGKMDENQEKAIVIYSNKRNLAKLSDFKKLQSYGILPITLLLRWTKNYNTAETKASDIYEILDCSSFFIDDYKCNINCLYDGPIDLGSDENGVYKFSIELNLLYRKGEK